MMTFSGLHDAVQRDDSEEIMSFLADGVDIHSRDELYEWTPLKVAAYYGRMAAARTLFEHGAQNTIPQKEFDEALLFGARSHSEEFIRLFLEDGRHLLTTKTLTRALSTAACLWWNTGPR
jgi:ankyrin repeat protein